MAVDEGLDQAAEACVRKFGDDLRGVLRAAFLAGAEWGAAQERIAIIGDLRRRADAAGPAEPGSPGGGGLADAVAAAPHAAEDAPAPPNEPPSRLIPGSTTDAVVDVVSAAGPPGISMADILNALRGAAPPGGQRDNTVAKAVRRAVAQKRIGVVDGKFVIIVG